MEDDRITSSLRINGIGGRVEGKENNKPKRDYISLPIVVTAFAVGGAAFGALCLSDSLSSVMREINFGNQYIQAMRDIAVNSKYIAGAGVGAILGAGMGLPIAFFERGN